MKFLLLFISLTGISWGLMSTTPDRLRPIESKIGTTVYEIFPVDTSDVVKEKHGNLNTAIEETLEKDYLVEFTNPDELEDPCLDNCQVYVIRCSCGETVTFQWCPCPWFPPSPNAAAAGYCDALCNQQ